METVAPPPVDQELEVHLLGEWRTPAEIAAEGARLRKAAAWSAIGHVVAIFLLALVPAGPPPEPPPPPRRVTPIFVPPELTQKPPNQGKVSKEFDALEFQARPRIQIPQGASSTTRAKARKFSESPTPEVKAPPAPLPEAPKIEVPPKADLPVLAQSVPVKPPERPRSPFENVPPPPPAVTPGQGRIAVPNASVSEAIRQSVRGTQSSGQMVGDDLSGGIGGFGDAVNQPPAPGVQGSQMQLLSDPQGVDFRAYLTQVLAAVRRGWYAVMPESARLGRRGLVSLQFAIVRTGQVAKIVYVTNSGTDALDRAAVAGVSAAVPFAPLPTEFKGERIVVQLNFAYNMPKR